MMEMSNYSHGWGMGGGMWILSILFWGFVVFGIFFIVKGLFSQNRAYSGPATNDTPITILKKRYAKGEIDQSTFEQMKNELKD